MTENEEEELFYIPEACFGAKPRLQRVNIEKVDSCLPKRALRVAGMTNIEHIFLETAIVM